MIRDADSRRGGLLSTQPAMLGEVNRDAVRHRELDLDIASLRHFIGSGIGAMHGTRLLDPGPPLRHVVDFETKVVQPSVLRRALRGCRVVVFELQDREIHVAVAQVVAFGCRSVDFSDLLQAEALNIEPRRRLWVPRADCDVSNSAMRYGLFYLPSLPARARSKR